MKTAPDPHIRLLLVDDHVLMREGVRSVLALEADFVVVAEAGSVAEARTAFRKHQPDVTLMDIHLSDGTGIETVAELRSEFPAARFLMLSTYEGDDDIHRALSAGAAGYLLKTVGSEELATAIRTVHRGQQYLSAEVAARLRERRDYRELTAREREVLALLVKGLSNKEIASVLEVSEFTVKAHLRSILPKLGAEDRTQAVTIALQRGLAKIE